MCRRRNFLTFCRNSQIFLVNLSFPAFLSALSIDENTKKPSVQTSDRRVHNFRDFVQIFCVRQKTNT